MSYVILGTARDSRGRSQLHDRRTRRLGDTGGILRGTNAHRLSDRVEAAEAHAENPDETTKTRRQLDGGRKRRKTLNRLELPDEKTITF